MIFDQQLKITFRKSSDPLSPEKIHSPFYSLPSPKNLKVASSPLFDNIENFLGCPSRKGGRTLWLLCRSSSFFSLLLFFCYCFGAIVKLLHSWHAMMRTFIHDGRFPWNLHSKGYVLKLIFSVVCSRQ